MSSIDPQKGNKDHNRTRETPEHLSEFSSFMSGLPTPNGAPKISSKEEPGPSLSPLINSSNSNLTPGNSSIRSFLRTSPMAQVKRRTLLNTLDTFTSFSPSVLDLTHIVTHKDFNKTEKKYEGVISASARLRRAMEEVSKATEEFGKSLEDCVNDYSSKYVCDGMMSAAGLHYMVSLNQQILARLLLQNFEEPFEKELKKLRTDYDENQKYYEQEIRARLKELRTKEIANLQISKQKTRNLLSYKSNLVDLTRQVEEIDRLKYGYYREVNTELDRFARDFVLPQTGSLVRAQLEVYESFARKGWEGGGLDTLLAISPDILAADLPEDNQPIVEENNIEVENEVPNELDNDNKTKKTEKNDNENNVRHENNEAVVEEQPGLGLDGEIYSHRTTEEDNGTIEDFKDVKNKLLTGWSNSEADIDRLKPRREEMISNRSSKVQEKKDDKTSPIKSDTVDNFNVEDSLNTIKSNLKKVHTSTPEGGKHNDELDESFSLPVVHNLKSLLKTDEEEEKEKKFDSTNILQDLGL